MTKERPILFSGPMVRAILDGRKTQTRRVVKPQPLDGDRIERCGYPADGWIVGRNRDSENAWRSLRCPYGVPGDVLWVREKWMHFANQLHNGQKTPHIKYGDGTYRDGPRMPDASVPVREDWTKWRPSIHMPRWACRLTLRVESVRVERLNDITYADCHAEGIEPAWGGTSEIESFERLWDSINGKKYPWASSPWVWVVTFARL